MTLSEVIDTLQTWIRNADDEYDREEMGRVAGLKEALREIKKIDAVVVDCAHRCEYCKYEKLVPSYEEPCESCSIKELDMTTFIDNFEPKEEEKNE